MECKETGFSIFKREREGCVFTMAFVSGLVDSAERVKCYFQVNMYVFFCVCLE